MAPPSLSNAVKAITVAVRELENRRSQPPPPTDEILAAREQALIAAGDRLTKMCYNFAEEIEEA